MPEPGQVQPQPAPVNPAAPTMQPVVNPAPAAQPQPQVQPHPDWSNDLVAAGNDSFKLHSIANNSEYPEEIRNKAFERAYELDVKNHTCRIYSIYLRQVYSQLFQNL